MAYASVMTDIRSCFLRDATQKHLLHAGVWSILAKRTKEQRDIEMAGNEGSNQEMIAGS